MRILDLCSGTGGWVHPWREADHEVLTLDIDPRFGCDLTMDVRDLRPAMLPWVPDIVFASPPCQEFSRHSQPWTRKENPPDPDLSLVTACIYIGVQSTIFVLENVRGAIPWLGPHRWRWGPFFLWGNFPVPGPSMPKAYKKPDAGVKDRPILRAAIPRQLSDIMMRVCLFEYYLS